MRVRLAAAATADSVVDGDVSLADLAGTLLHDAAVPVPAGMREGPLQGAAEAYAETEYPRTAGWHGLAALAFDQWKVILSSEPELYDVAADPGEAHNLAAQRSSLVDGARRRIAALAPAPPARPRRSCGRRRAAPRARLRVDRHDARQRRRAQSRRAHCGMELIRAGAWTAERGRRARRPPRTVAAGARVSRCAGVPGHLRARAEGHGPSGAGRRALPASDRPMAEGLRICTDDLAVAAAAGEHAGRGRAGRTRGSRAAAVECRRLQRSRAAVDCAGAKADALKAFEHAVGRRSNQCLVLDQSGQRAAGRRRPDGRGAGLPPRARERPALGRRRQRDGRAARSGTSRARGNPLVRAGARRIRQGSSRRASISVSRIRKAVTHRKGGGDLSPRAGRGEGRVEGGPGGDAAAGAVGALRSATSFQLPASKQRRPARFREPADDQRPRRQTTNDQRQTTND